MNIETMKTLCNQWSVATAFNQWNMWRSRKQYQQISQERREFDLEPGEVVDLIPVNEINNVESVANCIRDLGYEVDCGFCELGSYIILCIYNDTYKGSGKLLKSYYGTKSMCSDDEQLRNHRYLAGDRTVYESVMNFAPEVFRCNCAVLLRDSSSIITEQKMKNLIDNGCIKNLQPFAAYSEKYFSGASTIGNTLPNDIVYALKNFDSDSRDFVKEPDYEFYIPEDMVEILVACPLAEDSMADVEKPNGNLDVCPAPLYSSENSASNSSSSSDDED